MDSKYGWIASLLMVTSLLLAGCGGDVGGRATVKGRVTLGGTPIKQGSINLVPLDSAGSDATGVGGPITDGTYELSGEQSGPMLGKYRVQIYGFEPIAPRRGAEAGDAEAESATRQVVPREFNEESTLELDVDSTLVEKDFDLTP
jgi:hypothetical protein